MRAWITAAIIMVAATMAFAADIDRHASYTETAGAKAVCKEFVGSDDNRTECQDWCAKWTSSHEGGSCSCDDGNCEPPQTEPAETPH